ncbi:MAG: porin, partial [Bacteroidota bacterium]
PGGVLGVSFYAGNSGQGQKDLDGSTITASTTVFSVHGEYAWNSVELRALYAYNSIDEADKVSRLAGRTIGSSMNGYYAVVGYDVIPLLSPGSVHSLAPFIQYQRFNTHASVAAGYTANRAFDRTILTAGLSYKPHPNVAMKFDYSDNKNGANTGVNQWNLAVNYLF